MTNFTRFPFHVFAPQQAFFIAVNCAAAAHTMPDPVETIAVAEEFMDRAMRGAGVAS